MADPNRHDSCLSGDIYRHLAPVGRNLRTFLESETRTQLNKLLLNMYLATKSLGAAPKFIFCNPQKSLVPHGNVSVTEKTKLLCRS